MFNPMQAMQQATRQPVQAAVQQMAAQLGNNPLYQRAQQMAQGKSEAEIRQIAQNLCQQRGIDINQAWQQFQSMFGGFG